MGANPGTWAVAVSLMWACSGDVKATSIGTPPPGENPAPTTVPEAGTFVKRSFTIGTTSYPYQVFVPAAYTTGSRWPAILYIHPSSHRGTDGDRPVSGGLGPAVKAQARTFPAFAVFPQVPPGERFDRTLMIQIVLGALDQVMKDYRIDSTRVYATGPSFGGVLAYELAYLYPARFAAIAPVSAALCDPCITGDPKAPFGAANATVARQLKATPTWVFHGATDTTIPVALARDIVAAFQSAGGTVRYTEYPTDGHTAVMWDKVYGSVDLYGWLLAQRR